MVQMSTSRRKSQPNPPPKTGEARRLERVRKLARAATLAEFHRQLEQPAADGSTYSVSYAAVRRYHYDRVPSAEYMARVCKVFPQVRMEWLLSGVGEMTHAEQQMGMATEERGDSVRQLRHAVPGINDLPYTVAVALLHHVDLWEHAQGFLGDTSGRLDYARSVWDDIVAPFNGRRPWDFAAFAEYVNAALVARNLALLIDTFDPHSED